MTPTAQIAAIRQWYSSQSYAERVTVVDARRAADDIAAILQQWDARESALRALVAELRAAGEDDLNDYAVGYLVCADRVARLLESEQ